jgi:hypothetical protein
LTWPIGKKCLLLVSKKTVKNSFQIRSKIRSKFSKHLNFPLSTFGFSPILFSIPFANSSGSRDSSSHPLRPF